MERFYQTAHLEVVDDRLFVATTAAAVDGWLKLLYVCNVNDLPSTTFNISEEEMWKGAIHLSADSTDSTAVEVSRLSQRKDAILIRVTWYAVSFINNNKSYPPNVTQLYNDIVFLNVKNVEFHVDGAKTFAGRVWWVNSSDPERIVIAPPDTAGGLLSVHVAESIIR
jgi:hypothetical protein